MDKQIYLRQLGRNQLVSVGLAAYIGYVLITEPFKAKQLITLGQSEINATTLLSKGSARLYTENQDKQQNTLLFYQTGSFLSIEREMKLHTSSKLCIEFLEDSELSMVPDKHIANLYKLFPEFQQIQNGLNQVIKQTLFHHHLNLSLLDAEKRYNLFLIQFGHITLVCEQKKIASFLGIDPKTLSRLRGKTVR